MIKSILLIFFALLAIKIVAQNKVDFRYELMDKSKAKLSDLYKDGPVLVNFWATWCKPCLHEIKALNKMYENYKREGFKILGVNQDTPRSLTKVKALVSSSRLKYLIALDANKEIAEKFNVQAVPANFLIDKNGEIVFTSTGYFPGDEVEIEDALKKILEKK